VPGRPRTLTGPQIRWIYTTITQKNPLQLKFEFALWTRAMIRTLIRRRVRRPLSVASVGRLLRQLGLTCPRPLTRAFQQDPARVQRWLTEEYPPIKALAKAMGAAIFFANEAGVRSDYHAGTTWAPRGQTPVGRIIGARFGLNMISAVSAGGHLRFMIVDGQVDAARFCQCLQRLLVRARRPIFLIVDGHPVHRAARVAAFLASTRGRLRLFALPPYSPELNPDELVWNAVKHHGLGRQTLTGPRNLKTKVLSNLWRLQQQPTKVRAFFHAPSTVYAA
jgi:transposase